jgi:hypothetical protein
MSGFELECAGLLIMSCLGETLNVGVDLIHLSDDGDDDVLINQQHPNPALLYPYPRPRAYRPS